MANERFDNTTKQKLEQIFGMAGGYVLDFSNASFAAFVEGVTSDCVVPGWVLVSPMVLD